MLLLLKFFTYTYVQRSVFILQECLLCISLSQAFLLNQSTNAFSNNKKTHEFVLQCGFNCVFSRVPHLYVATQMPQSCQKTRRWKAINALPKALQKTVGSSSLKLFGQEMLLKVFANQEKQSVKNKNAVPCSYLSQQFFFTYLNKLLLNFCFCSIKCSVFCVMLNSFLYI